MTGRRVPLAVVGGGALLRRERVAAVGIASVSNGALLSSRAREVRSDLED